MGVKREKIDLSPEQIRLIASRKALGASIKDMESEFGFSRFVINRALGTELAKGIQKEIVERAISSAVVVIRRELADMSALALGALRHNLAEKSMEAVKTYFKALGIEQTEKADTQQAQTFQVILPGAPAPPREVEHEVSEEH